MRDGGRVPRALSLACLGVVGALATRAEEPALRFAESSLSALVADDLRLADGLVQFREEAGSWRYRLGLTFSSIELDYAPAPVDVFSTPRTLEEHRLSLDGEVRFVASEALTWIGAAGGYDGFAGYRSLWINEWYQQYFAGLPGLEDPAPRGAYAAGGVRWAYRGGAGVLESRLTWARERIAPGYDEVLNAFGGLVGVMPLRARLQTLAWTVSTENILAGWLRTRLEYQFAKQSERELRHGIVGRANVRLAPAWFAQLEAGAVFEQNADPTASDFLARWIRAELRWRAGDHWIWDLGGRLYRDNGEIENSIGFSSAAPDVEVVGYTIGVRYLRGDHALRASLGRRSSDYAPVGFRNQFFGGLYRDRDFTSFELTYSYGF